MPRPRVASKSITFRNDHEAVRLLFLSATYNFYSQKMFISPLGHALLAIPLISSLFVSGVVALPHVITPDQDTHSHLVVARGPINSQHRRAAVPPSGDILAPQIYSSCTVNNTVAISECRVQTITMSSH